MKLNEARPGNRARIIKVGGAGALRQHFLDMGVIPGAEITLVKLAPMKDPMEFRIHGYELTLRVADASQIKAQIIDQSEETGVKAKNKAIEHPGLGEDGRYHDPKNENPLPEGTKLKS